MAISEFRYNKKRKHHAYIYGKKGDMRQSISLSSKPIRIRKKENGRVVEMKNIKLTSNPNPEDKKDSYLIPKRNIDHKDSFGRKHENWKFHTNDRRVVKRIIKNKK